MNACRFGCLGPVSYLFGALYRLEVPVQKQETRSLFNSIARHYDLLNHLLSGGIDLYWRRRAVEQLREIRPKRILDVATGTGDFAVAATRLGPEEIVGIDISEEMLRIAEVKLQKKNLNNVIHIKSGDAEHIDGTDGSFDAAMVAFGVRNFEDLETGLREMRRSVRPGGMVLVLEFSKPKAFLLRQLYFFYFLNVLPHIGRLLSRNKGAYRYLPESVLRFPEGEEFIAILRRVGFTQTYQVRMTFGIATAYVGVK